MVREHILLILMHLIKCAYADPSVRGHARLRQCSKHLCVCVCVCVCARALVSRYAHSCARTCMHISDASPLLSLSTHTHTHRGREREPLGFRFRARPRHTEGVAAPPYRFTTECVLLLQKRVLLLRRRSLTSTYG